METISGIVDLRLVSEGSKSEGRKAVLCSADGREYILYRADMLPINDAFFTSYDKQHLAVRGVVESSADKIYLCVSSLILDDGTELSSQPATSIPSDSIFLCDGVEDVADSPKRIPRKLKKRLKISKQQKR